MKQEQIESRPVEGRWFSAQWAIAAADLQPAQAKTILYNAWKRFGGDIQQEDRALLALSLLERGGNADVDFVRTWVYREAQQTRTYPAAHDQLFSLLKGGTGKNVQDLTALLIADSRLNTLNFGSLKGLVELVNTWLPEPLVTWQEIHAVHRKPEEAQEMARWRSKLRASVSQWNKN